MITVWLHFLHKILFYGKMISGCPQCAACQSRLFCGNMKSATEPCYVRQPLKVLSQHPYKGSPGSFVGAEAFCERTCKHRCRAPTCERAGSKLREPRHIGALFHFQKGTFSDPFRGLLQRDDWMRIGVDIDGTIKDTRYAAIQVYNEVLNGRSNWKK